MVEAINKYYLEDGNIDTVDKFVNDDNSNKNIIYEVLRVKNGVPLFLIDHIKRMEKSFDLVNIKFPYTIDKISEYATNLIIANNNIEGNIKITYNIATETVKIFYIAHKYPSIEAYNDGVKTILFHGERDNPNAKIVNSTFRERVNKEIKDANAYEAILVDRNGEITEGSRSNIFFISQGKLITAPPSAVLLGVTRAKVIQAAEQLNIAVIEKEVKYTELNEVDALFISGTSPKVLPINMVDDMKFDVNNEVLRKIMKKYDEIANKYIELYLDKRQ